MNKTMSFIIKNFLLIILVVISLSLFYANLSGQDYSLDEPETIVLARSIFIYGFPSPWDGQNLVSTNNGKDLINIGVNYFWQWQPWLQHYLIFLGINIFGDNIFGQRSLFALFGVGTVLLTYFTGKELFRNKYVPFIISFQLLFLLPFFLYARSARYYSLSAFFSLAIFYLLIINFKGKWTKKHLVFLFIAGLLLFFSNYIVWLTTTIFVLVSLILRKNKAILNCIILQIIVAIIWFIFFKPYSGNVLVFDQLSNLLINMLRNISYINNFIFPLILVPFLLLIKKLNKKFLLIIFSLIVLKIFIYSIFLIPHGRYLVDLFAILILIFGYLYDYLISQKKLFTLFLLFFLVAFTNLLNVFPFLIFNKEKVVFNFWPKSYYHELSGKYETIMPQLGNYLKENYKNGDLFLSNGYPWYIYNYSKVPSVSPICDSNNNNFLGPKEIIDKNKIRWILVFPFENDKYNFPCFKFKNIDDLEKEFKLIRLDFSKNTRVVNDVDIFNRQFPPIGIRKDEVLLFERL